MPSPTVTRVQAATRELEQANRLLRDVYETPMTLRADPPRDFEFVADSITDGSLSLGRLRYRGEGSTGVDSFPSVCIAMCVGGAISWRVGGQAGAGSAPFFIPPALRVDSDWTDLALVTVSLETDVLEAGAEARTGRPDALRLDGPNPEGLDTRYMQAVVRHLDTTSRTAPDLLESPLVRAAMTQSAVDAALSAYPILDTAAPAGGPALPPRSVRRAIAFFDENLARAITAADAARAIGTSQRALELAFRRHLDLTPTQYLRRARLAAARRELQAADPATTTVRDIAARWGFGQPSRFAQYYRTVFGELPSTTLDRG